MSAALLKIWIGPVQDFIAAARRTRDLWFGSWLLSEIGKAAALAVAEHPATGGADRLIFPAPETTDVLKRSDLSVANVILSEVVDGSRAPEVAAAARKAAEDRWRALAQDPIFEDGLRRALRMDLWESQVGDVVEFYAAWVALSGDYAQSRVRLDRLLAGRKACRDFLPDAGLDVKIPKSSLDGKRASVLRPPEEIPKDLAKRLRTTPGEQLDAVGLTKRLSTGKQPYPSLTRVAADPWLRGLKATVDSDPSLEVKYRDLVAACADLRADKTVHKLDSARFPQYGHFPYEGGVVYPNRWKELHEESRLAKDDPRFERLARALAPLTKRFGEPDPYVAVLLADGDRMGDLISSIKDPAKHRAFSRLLSTFAGDVKEIVTDFQGTFIYSGGDDVLALLPTDQCIQCARKLYDRFQESMTAACGSHGNDSLQRPTLSVGIAIGHFLEDLELLLNYSRDAEKLAKRGYLTDESDGRNSLAVCMHPRSGSPIRVRDKWEGGEHDPLDKRLLQWATLFSARAIPSALPYDYRSLVRQYDEWPRDDDSQRERLSGAIRSHAELILRKKKPNISEKHATSVKSLLSRVADAPGLRRLSEEMLVARRIGRGIAQASGKSSSETDKEEE